MNRKNFKKPDDIFRGTDFWMLNDALTKEGIEKQIAEMKDKGVHSFIARTYIGLKSDYPGPDFMSKMHIIVDTAKKYGLKVFIQAGYMPEAVVGLPDRSALRYILPVKPEEVGDRRVFCTHDGYAFVEHDSKTFLDMFDSDAMDYYLKKSYEEMWADFSDEYGKTILSVWVDEPSYNGMHLPFTPVIETLWREKFGSEFAPEVWKLFYDADDYQTVRYRYRVLLRDLLEDNYFKKVRVWCNDHNLLFSGHLMMEETCGSQITRAGACMPYYKYFDIPGIDVLAGAMNWVDDPINPVDPGNVTAENRTLCTTSLQCVSAARQAGQKHILAEMYGVTTESMTFRDMLCMFDSYAAMGISHRSVHGIFYSLRGRGKRAYPPHVSYYQPYWAKYKNVTDYCARVSEFISEGSTEGDIAILHPLETAYMGWHGRLGERGAGGTEELDRRFYSLIRLLKTNHRDPELCDLATIRDLGRVEKGHFIVGQMSYGTLILPGIKTVTPTFVELLESFARQGGRLIILGSAPDMLDGVNTPGLADRISSLGQTVPDEIALLRLLEGDKKQYVLTGKGVQNLFVNRRVTETGLNFFIHNEDCAHEVNALLEVGGEWKAYLCDGFDGRITACPASTDGESTKVRIKIDAGSGIMLAFESGRPDACRPQKARRVLSLESEWKVIPSDPNTLLIDNFAYSTDGVSFSDSLPTVAIQKLLTDADYRGKLILRHEFDSLASVGDVTLALENPLEQELKLDGMPIEMKPSGHFCDDAFECVKLGRLGAGHHVLEITREFCPLSKFKSSITSLFETQRGVELEPVYLLGSFKVGATPRITRNGASVCEPDFRITSALSENDLTTGELTIDGFPFYMGRMVLETSFMSGSSHSCKIRVGVMNAGAGEVLLNGEPVGDLNRAPAEVSGRLKKGENKLSIVLYPTLRNIVGPFHRTRGDIGSHFGGGYANPDAAWLSVDTTQPGWEKRLGTTDSRWTEAYNLTPFGIGEVTVIS